MFLIPDSLKGYLLHLFILIAVAIGTVLYLFNSYLPEFTRHGEEITVPALQGKSISEVNQILESNGLKLLIFDSAYVDGGKPHMIMSQNPGPGQKVKKGRKIYLSVTSLYPTLVEMPNLKNMTLKNAQLQLTQAGLKLGDTINVDDRFTLILKQKVKGKDIAPGSQIAKFSKVDLIIGNGKLGKRED